MQIREMTLEDLPQATEVHKETFTRQRDSYKWLECSLNCFPRMLCFVATEQDEIVGYIIWAQKSGFRPEAIVELDQIAVKVAHQKKG